MRAKDRAYPRWRRRARRIRASRAAREAHARRLPLLIPAALTASMVACDRGPDLVIPNTLIVGSRIVDVSSGEVSDPKDVGILGDSIVWIRDTGNPPSDSATRVVDGREGYLIPGLWDMHAHIWDRDLLAGAYLDAGIVGVRDMGGTLEGWTGWRAEVDSVPLPRAEIAGVIVDGLQPFSFFYRRARDSIEAAEAVVELTGRGAHFIKVYDRLTRGAFHSIAREANRLEMPFAGHVPFGVPVSEALEAGIASVEHMSGIALECSGEREGLAAEILSVLVPFATDSVEAQSLFEPLGRVYEAARWEALDAYDREHCAALLEALEGAWITPTLLVTAQSDADKTARVEPHLETWPSWMRGMMRPRAAAGAGATPGRLATVRAMFGDLDRAGVRWLAGSDAPNPGAAPGIALHHELELLVDFGLSPAEALSAATVNAAVFLGRPRAGAVAVGYEADLVIVDGNPLDDIRATRSVRAVISRGRVVR